MQNCPQKNHQKRSLILGLVLLCLLIFTPSLSFATSKAIEKIIPKKEEVKAEPTKEAEKEASKDATSTEPAPIIEALPVLSEAIPVEDVTNGLADELTKFYKQSIKKLGLKGKSIRHVIGSGAVLFCYCLSLVIIHYAAFLVVRPLHRIERLRFGQSKSSGLYIKIIRWSGYSLLSIFLIVGMMAVWEFDLPGFLSRDSWIGLSGRVLSIFIILLIAVAVWEFSNFALRRMMKNARASSPARWETLFPVLQKAVLIGIVSIFALMILSEVGINIMPLLAGAGIVGIAIGLGAQSVVKDLLTGFTIIMEDLIRVGDVVKLADREGVIEKITIRKVQMRSIGGIVYTIPFHEIGIIENYTKNFSFYVLEIGIAYKENIDQVMEYLKEIDVDMRADDAFKKDMLEPIEIFGLDRFADSAVIIKARLKTRAGEQWTVGREFNRRMKMLFDARGIEIPFPHRTVFFMPSPQKPDDV